MIRLARSRRRSLVQPQASQEKVGVRRSPATFSLPLHLGQGGA